MGVRIEEKLKLLIIEGRGDMFYSREGKD